MGYQQKYAKLTNGPVNGPFGLVDIAHRGIWLNLRNEQVAHQIKQTFNSKLTLAVIDLSTFVNYTETLMHSETCLSWSLPHTTKLLLSTHSLNYKEFARTHNDYNTVDPLVNTTPKMLLTMDRRLELQDQILLYKKIVEVSMSFYQNIGTINRSAKIEYANEFFERVRLIFLTELTLSNIEKELYTACNDYFSKLPLVCSFMLDMLGRLYE